MSAFVSASVMLALVMFLERSSDSPRLGELLFPSALIFLAGWGFAFNAWFLLQGRDENAVCLAYPNDGPEPARLMTPRFTTFVLGAFWTSALLQFCAAAG